ncbi:MAG: carbohydrate-binding domain-containing protein [Acidimicrobiales bacterium]|nr:carbohydrate-binding domain-containing protein [Acidimicrobiales bacterium]
MRHLRALTLVSGLSLFTLAACLPEDATPDSSTTATVADDATPVVVVDDSDASAATGDTGPVVADTWDAADEVLVTLAGDTAESPSAAVDVDGSTVEITEPGTYRITGTLDDGNVEIDSEVEGLVRIVLDGVDVTSSTTSPFAVVQATEVVVHLADGSTNVFTDAASYPLLDAEHDEPDAAFFSDDPMTITGSGTLEVHANFQDGIVGQDTLQIDGGTIVVTAVDDAIRGNDSLVVNGGAITVAANGDGVKSDLVLTVNGGTIDVQQSYEGLEAETITINGGTIDVAADDDGVNAASDTGSPSLTVTGGTITVDAGGDGLDVNGSITMTGGTVLVDGPTADMNGALDYDGTFDISGGLFIATGSSGMAMAPSASSAQLSLLGVFATQAAGTTVTVLASDGTEVASITPTKPYSSLTMSTAALSADDTYSVVVDGTTLLTTTTDQAIGAGGMGGRGGGPGGPGGGGRP